MTRLESTKTVRLNPTPKAFRLCLAALCCLTLSSSALLAQVDTGTPPFGSFSGGPDVVNNANLNVHISIPALAKPGRGTPFSYVLSYDSSVWYPVGVSGSQVWTPVTNWGWRGITEVATGYITYATTERTCRDPETGITYSFNQYSQWAYHDPFGVQHSFVGIVSEDHCWITGNPITATATDGSGYTMTFEAPPSATLQSKSGDVIHAPLLVTTASGYATDSNGNKITATYAGSTTNFYDTLSSTTAVLTATTSGTPINTLTLTYKNSAGTNKNVVVNYSPYTVRTNFTGCSPSISNYGPVANVYLVSSIDLPGQTGAYTFDYEATPGYAGNVTGRLASVTFPTGGTITYEYYGGSGGNILCADGSTPNMRRTVSPGGLWDYDRAQVSGSHWTTKITAPGGDQTVVHVNGIYETQRKIFEGSEATGSLLATVDTCYNGAAIPCTGTAVAQPITNRTVQTTIGSLVAKTYAEYDATTGVLTRLDEHTWAVQRVRKTVIAYAGLGNNIVDRPSSITVYKGDGTTVVNQTTFAYTNTVTATSGTPQHVSVSGDRGNLASITSSGLTRSFSYYDTGTVRTSTDPKGNVTTLTYGASSCGNSFPTGVSLPLSLSTSAVWNCYGGVPSSSTDANSKTTNFSYDDLWRLTQTAFPDNGTQSVCYTSPTQRDIYISIASATTCASPGSGNRHDQITLDSLGRPTSQTAAGVTTSTTYNNRGQVDSVSISGSGAQDSYTYDALGRALTVTHADGNLSTATYANNCATTTDEAGKARKICTDGLGRATQVYEDPAVSNYLTSYAYDELDNLTSVTQGAQTRTYTYDSLGRLLSAATPETGTTTFTYPVSSSLCSGDPSTVCTRTDARNVVTTFAYDALNRLIYKTYSDNSATARYYYDEASYTLNGSTYTLGNTKGRLSHTVTGASTSPITATIYGYDSMGRVDHYWQCFPFTCTVAGQVAWLNLYWYNLAGDISSHKYTSAFTVTNTISADERVTAITSSIDDVTYPPNLATMTYTPWGGLQTLSNGCKGTGCVERKKTYDYNNRLQVVRAQLGTAASPAANDCVVYNYYSSVANPTTCTATPSQATTGNNGDVMGYFFQDSTASPTPSVGHTASYTYDTLNRLATSVATGSQTNNLTFSSDRYGNMTCVTNGSTNGPCGNWTFNAANNRITNTAFSYDAAGNLTADGTGMGTHTYQWDGENRLKSVDSGTTVSYTYNALGQRVEKKVGSVYTEYVYGAYGELFNLHDRTTWTAHIIPMGATPLAVYQDGTTRFFHPNALGSTTFLTDHTGAVTQKSLFYPWGQRWTVAGTLKDERFASLGQRDAETTTWQDPLDPTLFRLYTSGLGRWLSPDPLGGSVTNPQSLNRYAYVLNNPTNFIDPLGLIRPCPKNDGCQDDAPEPTEPIASSGQGCFVPMGLFSFYYAFCPDVGRGPSRRRRINNPNVSKAFQKTFDCGNKATEVISDVTANFSEYADYSGSFDVFGLPLAHSDVWFGVGPVTQGGSISIFNVNSLNTPGSIDPMEPGAQVVTSVNVALVTPTSFTFDTVPGHVLYPASITFSAQDMSSGQVRFSIQVNGNFANRLDEVVFKDFGGSNLEDNIWNNMLNNVAQSCGPVN